MGRAAAGQQDRRHRNRAEPLRLDYRPIGDLIPYARNARTHSEAQVALIAGSIREFGFTNPVLVDGANGIIAGHGRVLAARQLGMATVPVIELAHLTRGAEAGLHPRRQPARRAGRLGPRAAGAGAGRTRRPRHRPRRASASSRPSLSALLRHRPRSARGGHARAAGGAGEPRRAISGCSARTGCSAATAPALPTSRGCSTACGRI